MVFRTPDGWTPEVPSLKTEAPPVLGFGIDSDRYVLLVNRDGGVERWAVPAHGTDSRSERARYEGPFTERSRALVAEKVWLVTEQPGRSVGAPTVGAAPARAWGGKAEGWSFPLWIDGSIRLLTVKSAGGGSPRVTLADAADAHALMGPFPAGNTARIPLAACATVHGPVAIFSTDRDDEVDVCALRDGAAQHKTVSLGHGQTFVTAAGGGTRVAIVSRKGNDVRVRTIASDLRNELNAVPLAPGVRAPVGAVRAVHAGGHTFVIAHEEQGDTAEVVTTVFEDGRARTVRSKFPAVHGLALSGKHVAIAALTGGSLSSLLYVQQLVLARDEARSESFPASPKRRAYVLGDPPSATPQARKGALMDAAEVLSQSLAAQPPRELALASHDGEERAAFIVPGSDSTRDISVSVSLSSDGSAIVNVKLGDGSAPPPRPLTMLERLKVAVTGDDDADPSTTHFELDSLSRDLGQVVMAVWALRLTRR